MSVSKLEDELGDILSKARKGLGISMENVGTVAGYSAAQISAIESYQLTPSREKLNQIAQKLNLNFSKLASIAFDGWTPSSKDLSAWGNIESISSNYGGYEVKCYLSWNDDGETMLIDTGVDDKSIFDIIELNKLTLSTILITHKHGDHVAVLDKITNHFPHAAVYGYDRPIEDGIILKMSGISIEVRNTPGHSSDGMTYVVSQDNDITGLHKVAYVGDAIFAGSVGSAGCSYENLLKNVREKILTLPPTTLLCPGHGPVTTVEEEHLHNPFFK